MELFPHEQITQLGPNEMRVYNYVIMHIEDVPSMSIRTLAKEVGVSTTTVLRFCEKVGCEGYQELKYLIKRKVEDDVLQDVISPQDQARAHQFLREAGSDPRIVERIKRASALIASARSTAFLGVGTIANLAEYGARYFANLGLPSISVLDPFFPRVTYDVTGTVLVALSVSGSTEQVMMQTEAYKEHGAQIITITSAGCSAAAASCCVVFPPQATKLSIPSVEPSPKIKFLRVISAIMHSSPFWCHDDSLLTDVGTPFP